MKTIANGHVKKLICVSFFAFILALPAAGATSTRSIPFDIASEPLSLALRDYAKVSGQEIIFTEDVVVGKTAPAIKGSYTAEAALARLLEGSGLAVERSPSGAAMILRPRRAIKAWYVTQDGQFANSGDSPATQSTSQPIVGQDAGSSSQSALEEIIVTAQKRTERLQDVPMSVSVISGDRLTATQATTLQDIANAVPGLQLVSGSPATNTLVIRGISLGAGINASVATYVDEVPYTSQGPFSYSTNIAPNFDPYDVARVEVLRGPQGTLYGANALSGLLKYVTNAPDPSGYHASFLVGGNHVDHGGAGYELHGMVNIPLGSTAALRLTGGDTYFPGYIDDPSRGEVGINDVRRANVRAAFLWQANDDLTIRLSAAYQRLTAGDINDEDLDPATLRPLYGDLTHIRDLPQPERISNQIYNATIDWNLGFGSLTSSTSWTKVDPHTMVDLSSSFGPLLDSIFGGNYGAASAISEPVHSTKQELRLASAKQPWEWTVGVYYDDEAAHEFEPIYAADLDTKQVLLDFQPPLGAYYIDSTYREYAAFADVDYHLTSAFELGAGGRYSTNKQTYHQVNAGLFTGTNDFRTESDQDVFTYSVDAKYRFTPGLMAYARVASGFVPGGPNDAVPVSNLPLTFESSSTTNYELGVKGNADEGRIGYDVDVFDIEWKRIQLFALFGNFEEITNGGTARSRGLEGSFTYKPLRELTLMLNGAYTNARLTEDTPASFGGHDGDRLPLSPFFAGTAGADYERPIGSGVSGFGGIEWHYNGSRIAPFNFGGPRAVLPGYSMVDLRAGIKVHSYTVAAYVKNAGNVRAINDVTTETTIGGQAALDANIAMPRTIGLNVSASF